MLNAMSKMATDKLSEFNPTLAKVSTIRFSHLWTIANVTQLLDECHPWKWGILSDTCTPPHNNRLFEYHLELWPKGILDQLPEGTMVSVAVTECEHNNIECTVRIEIVQANEEECCLKGEFTLIKQNYVSLYTGQRKSLN